MSTNPTVQISNPDPQLLVISIDERIPYGSLLVRSSLLGDSRMRTMRQQTVEITVAVNDWFDRRVTAENDFLDDSARAKLDERGVIRPGSVLESGDMLVSVLSQQRSAPKQKNHPEKDASERMPQGWEGAVVEEVTFRSSENGDKLKKGVLAEIDIALRAEFPLQIGDVLAVSNRPLGVISATFPDDHDIDIRMSADVPVKFDSGTTQPVTRWDDLPRDFLRVRRTGPYSLITEIPLRREAITVTAEQIEWLLDHGLTHNSAELASLKSDDLTSRGSLEALLTQHTIPPEKVPKPGVPFSLLLVEAYLWGLGIRVERRTREGFHEWLLSPATNAELRGKSNGPIRKPETLNYRTLDPEPEGLFCAEVFGPQPGTDRWRRLENKFGHAHRMELPFGHLDMSDPVVPFVWRMGDESILSRLTGLSSRQLEDVLAQSSDLVVRDGMFDVTPNPPSTDDDIEEDIAENLGMGAIAVREMLSRIPASRLPSTWTCQAIDLVSEILLVLPEKSRPIILLDSGSFATSDLNDLYRQLINRRNRLVKLVELNAPEVICRNERRMLQGSADHLWANCLVNRPQRGDNRQNLVDIVSLLNRALNPAEKPVDWGGSARVVADNSVAAGTVEVPESLFKTLWLDPETPVLMTAPHTARFVAALPRSAPEQIIRLPCELYDKLSLDELPIGEVRCHIHRPLGTNAIREASALQRSDPEPRSEPRPYQEPLDVQQLVEAIWTGNPIPLNTGPLVLLAGLCQ